ncbi:MAG: signal peptidase I [Spirochaetales bacterium]|nr:signal peptidase I [Spirochaetales bacterium]
MRGFTSYSSYRKNKQNRGSVSVFLKGIIFAAIAVFAIQVSGFQTFVIQSDGMSPGYAPGERYIGAVYGIKNPFSSHFLISYRMPARGDVAVVRPGYLHDTSPLFQNIDAVVRLLSFQQLSLYRSQPHASPALSLRLIGLPGDVVSLEGGKAYIIPAEGSERIDEYQASGMDYSLELDYMSGDWKEDDPFGLNMSPVLLHENEYFLLADNRGSIEDSRYWGPIPREFFQTRLLFRYWPLISQHK